MSRMMVLVLLPYWVCFQSVQDTYISESKMSQQLTHTKFLGFSFNPSFQSSHFSNLILQ